jgi:hypothetical protein
MSYSYREYIQAAGVFLDALEPEWEWKISLGSLNMTSDKRCILGQIFGTFKEGRRRIWWADTNIILDLDPHISLSNMIKWAFIGRFWDAPYLGYLWRQLIRQRRKERKL